MKTRAFIAPLLTAAVLLLAAALFQFSVIGQGYKFLAFLLLLLAALLLAHGAVSLLKPGRRRRRLRLALHGLLALGILALAIGEVPVLRDAHTDPDPQADYLIVLGAGVDGEIPSGALTDRLKAALDYLRAYPDARAVLSGGQGPGEDVPEALVMYAWLENQGIDRSRLICEDKSADTRENIKNSLALIPEGASVAVCSSDYHLYRAKLCASRLGVRVKGVAAHTPLFLLNVTYFLRESCGAWHFWILGW